MIDPRAALGAALLAMAADAAAAQTGPAPDHTASLAHSRTLGCAGVFGRDTTHARLVEAFGARNVVFKEVEGSQGKQVMASVLFEDDPPRHAVVIWRDPARKANPASIMIGAPSTWRGPGGIHNGLPLKDVEKLNGGAFKLTGFGGASGGGLVLGLKPALANPDGGCTLTVRFEPGIANPLPEKFAAITGSREVPSSHPLLRRARPQVSEWIVTYR